MDVAVSFIQLFIIVQAFLFLLFISINKRLRLLPNKILAGVVLLLALHMLVNLLSPELNILPLNQIGIVFGFCYGPIFYLYSRSLAYQNFQLTRRQGWHALLPFCILLVVHTVNISAFVYAMGIFVSLASYSVAIWRLLRRYQFILCQTRTEYEQITLNWLWHLLLLQLGLLLLNIFSVAMYSSGQMLIGQALELVLFIGLWGLVSSIIFHGMQHPMLFSGVSKEDALIIAPQTDEKLSDDVLQEIMNQLENYIESQNAHLIPGLTVKELAKRLSLSPRFISQAINTQAHKNFSEYINEKRIQHACRLLRSAEHQDLTIMDVMLESGFNTKSNFNRAFKLITGTTPYEYKSQ